MTDFVKVIFEIAHADEIAKYNKKRTIHLKINLLSQNEFDGFVLGSEPKMFYHKNKLG